MIYTVILYTSLTGRLMPKIGSACTTRLIKGEKYVTNQ